MDLGYNSRMPTANLGLSTSQSYRKDIDGLRCLAVISVVVGHYFPTLIPKGFLGVDVFFVISGFVITQMLFEMDKKEFNSFLITFYAKRIRRIIPALLVVVTVSMLITLLFISAADEAIGNAGAYALVALSNMYFWHLSSDYFGLIASQNPLTHTWSLGVEEQFYLIYPIVFFLIWKFGRDKSEQLLIALVLCTLAFSLTLNVWLSQIDFNLAFYSMPTRLWELNAGILAFLLVKKSPNSARKIERYRFFLLILLLSALFFSILPMGFSQILVVFTAALLLYPSSNNFVYSILSNQKVVWVGLRSYSIYLTHWPILVFSNYMFGSTSVVKNVFFIVFTFLVSAIMYRFVENSFRFGKLKVSDTKTVSWGLVVILLTSATILLTFPRLSQMNLNLFPRILGIADIPEWQLSKCSGSKNVGKLINPIYDCLGVSKSESARHVYLIGDSHADQLLPMLKSAFRGPAYGVKNLNLGDEKDFPYVEFKSNSLSPSLAFLESNAKLGDVVILTFHRGRLNPSRDLHVPLDKHIELTAQTTNLAENLNRFSLKMRNRGVTIVLVKDTPLMASVQSSQSCAMQLRIFGTNGCLISRIQDEHTRYLQSYAFNLLARNNVNVIAWDPFDYIYKNSETFDVVDSSGNYLMWDWNHVTEDFSRKLSPHFWRAIKEFINRY